MGIVTRTAIIVDGVVRTVRGRPLLEELEQLFLDDGFHEMTLGQMAAALHCSKSTLYYIGDSKEELVAAVVKHFFSAGTVTIEERVRDRAPGAEQLAEYLSACGDVLSAASPAFMRDLEANAVASEVYRVNIEAAARRVREIIDDGVSVGSFRKVHAEFVSEVVANAITAIGSGEIRRATGLSESLSYRELAGLVINGIRG